MKKPNIIYQIQSTEKTRESCSEYETKSLLYLITHDNRNQLEFLIIDVFNDVTGSNLRLTQLWDVQSKGEKI